MADREIAATEKNIEIQQQLAAQGLKNSLEFEQDEGAKALLAKEKALKQQEIAQKIAAFWSLLSNSESPQEAITKFGIGEAFAATIKALPAFEEGGETPGKPTLAVVGEKGAEFVHTADTYKRYKDEIQAMHDGSYDQLLANKMMLAGLNRQKAAPDSALMTISAELQATRKAIENGLPNVEGYFDVNTRVMTTAYKYKGKSTINKQKLPRL